MSTFDCLVVGAGFSGAVLAERLAVGLQRTVLVIDRRDHLGGNAYDFFDDAGILVHKYGPHIFHTNSKKVFDYLSQFTPWRHYEHRVKAWVDGRLVPFPINSETIRLLCGVTGTADQIANWLESVAEPGRIINNSEDAIVSKFGRHLFDKLFRSYTRKQWGLEASQLSPCVTTRVSARHNEDDRYFTDTYQVMPKDGYNRMFEKMLNHPNITVSLNTRYKNVAQIQRTHTFYTGPIDEFFSYCFGRLLYRSMRFVRSTLDCEQFQPVGVVTYPNDEDYTRITEFRHITGQAHTKTSIMYEFPTAEGEPFYPVPTAESASTYKRYRELARKLTNASFSGRLGSYQYLNMDQAVAQSLALFDSHSKRQPMASLS